MSKLDATSIRQIERAQALADERASDVRELLRCIQAIDLTTLNATDDDARVRELCEQAKASKVAAVCVYGRFVATAFEALVDTPIAVAAVAMGFPHGQSPLAARVLEVEAAVADGASEIDMVIQRGEALRGNWASVEREVRAARLAAPDAKLKVILETGELVDGDVIYRATRTVIDAGADFVKTSTGKIAVGATPQAAYAMLRAIRESGTVTGIKVAGGIRTTRAALLYAALVEDVLGDEWLDPSLFRIGGSALLQTLEKSAETLQLG